MTARSFMISYVAALLIVASCRKTETVQTATTTTTTAGTKTGTVAGSPIDLRRANIHDVINTRGVEGATRSHLGNTRGPDGTVPAEVTIFKTSDPIYLTMWIPDSPRGLQTRAEWFDEKGKMVRQDRRNMSGEKVITFEWSGKPPAPGKYRVVGYWGGNVAAEHEFTVEAAPAKAKGHAAKKKG